jgi:hypothetical protein
MTARLQTVFEELAAWGETRSWIGPDPYEGLNTPAGSVLRRSKRAMQAAIQLNRRSPVSLPWPLRASSRPNAKVAGLVLSGYGLPAGSRLSDPAVWAERMRERLEDLRLPDSGAWGYHFDVQTRHLFYPETEANAVATCFAIRGLLDAGQPAAALLARPFLLSLQRESEHGPFFAYVGAGSELIHNANLMVCGTLARLSDHDPDPTADQGVAAAVATTAALRRDDANWPYGERDDLAWRDNFHTAYTLEGLARVQARSGGYGELLATSLRAWLDTFFDADGTARYHPDRPYPADAHSFASAIDTLCVVAELQPELATELIERARRIALKAVDLLWIETEHRFAMQVTARGVNRREFMRWTNTPMFAALGRLLSA